MAWLAVLSRPGRWCSASAAATVCVRDPGGGEALPPWARASSCHRAGGALWKIPWGLAEKWGRDACGPRVSGWCGVPWSGSGLAAVRTESLQSVGEEERFGGGPRGSFLVGERGGFGW